MRTPEQMHANHMAALDRAVVRDAEHAHRLREAGCAEPGGRVRCMRRGFHDNFRVGLVYTVWSAKNIDREGRFGMSTLSLEVPDPRDNFGGVINELASCFEPAVELSEVEKHIGAGI